MHKPKPKTQDAYLHDMLEAAQLIRSYTKGVSFADFLANNEKRDAVALRISVLGESAHKIDKTTEQALPTIPFKNIRGMRNRIEKRTTEKRTTGSGLAFCSKNERRGQALLFAVASKRAGTMLVDFRI